MTAVNFFLVNEIYPCLQGEGPNAGRPSVLVRFQICNLRCSWCDTPYTHTFKSDPVSATNLSLGQKFKRLSLDELLQSIREHSTLRHVILSGGEPTLQNFSALAEILSSSHTLEVETNGTQIPHKLHQTFEELHYSLLEWNVSPKGVNAGQEINYDALKHWSRLSQSGVKVNFKFVLRKHHMSEDLREIDSILERTDIPQDRVIAMAEGTSRESQLGNAWLEEICMNRGWRISPRLYVLTHGNQRGV